MDVILLLVALAVILLGAELFTNGIEWFGHRLNLAEGAVGSVLAAVATAMPETLIPVIAIVGPTIFGGGSPNSAEIGVGAILGAPFMLSTLAMFVTGLAIVIFSRRGRRGTEMSVNVRVLGRDVISSWWPTRSRSPGAFLPADFRIGRWAWRQSWSSCTPSTSAPTSPIRPRRVRGADLNQLHLTRLGDRLPVRMVDIDVLPGESTGEEVPRIRIIVAQVVGALALIIIGAQVFVGAVEHLSSVIGLDPRILALVIAPIATELPESSTASIWVRSGKTRWRWATSAGRWSSRAPPHRAGILFTEWDLQGEQRARLRVGRRRLHLDPADLRPDACGAAGSTRRRS
jgi:cation:H+ antiporter